MAFHGRAFPLAWSCRGGRDAAWLRGCLAGVRSSRDGRDARMPGGRGPLGVCASVERGSLVATRWPACSPAWGMEVEPWDAAWETWMAVRNPVERDHRWPLMAGHARWPEESVRAEVAGWTFS
ncbi:MAG: hypothetical protein ACYDHX_13030 [Methanothrix sp.]